MTHGFTRRCGEWPAADLCELTGRADCLRWLAWLPWWQSKEDKSMSQEFLLPLCIGHPSLDANESKLATGAEQWWWRKIITCLASLSFPQNVLHRLKIFQHQSLPLCMIFLS
jgi:hypothetical protein